MASIHYVILFTLIMGGCLFFSKENWIYEGEEDDLSLIHI